jgi:nitronate monooxygenase
MVLDGLAVPIVLAPMGGGPSTPALAAAVSEAGGLGFLAAGYKTPDAFASDVEAVRAATTRPFGVNVFAPPRAPAAADVVAAYVERLASSEDGPFGDPRSDDDAFDAKLDVLVEAGVPVVSFTFGPPSAEVVERLHGAGVEAWATVTSAGEARVAAGLGADVLVVQGVEAGGHRGTFDDTGGDVGLLALLQVVRAETDLPLVATGGIATGAAIAAVLAAGARAAQLGTAFLLTPEAGTTDAQRSMTGTAAPTGLTRAFTGRLARGIVNRFQAAHSAGAPSAYPEIHHVTAPLRAAARSAGDPQSFNLWAGQAHALTRAVPAGQLVAELAAEARAALDAARLKSDPL